MTKKRSELKPTDEVVVGLGAKTESQNGKTVTIEKARDIVMTLAGYDELEKTADKDGHSSTLGRTVKLKGTPKYGDETETMAGAHREVERTEAFTSEKAGSNTPPKDTPPPVPPANPDGTEPEADEDAKP